MTVRLVFFAHAFTNRFVTAEPARWWRDGSSRKTAQNQTVKSPQRDDAELSDTATVAQKVLLESEGPSESVRTPHGKTPSTTVR